MSFRRALSGVGTVRGGVGLGRVSGGVRVGEGVRFLRAAGRLAKKPHVLRLAGRLHVCAPLPQHWVGRALHLDVPFVLKFWPLLFALGPCLLLL